MRAKPVPAGSRFDVRVLLLLAAITLALYLPTTKHQFLLLDDDYYVWKNLKVAQGITADSLTWALTTYNYFYWQPLTWISHMMDVEFYGLKPGGHHFTNAFLHALNSGLLLMALWKLTQRFWPSVLTAALFAWHPLRIESVAWVAERKDLLSATFWLLAMWTYSDYARTRSTRAYWLTVGAMLGGLASKPTVVTLPFALLLLDYWPLQRKESWLALVKEKLPFFAISIIGAIATFAGQQEMGAVASDADIPLPVRLANATANYARYLAANVWPHEMAVLYPYRDPVPVGWVIAGAVVLIGGSVLALQQAKRRPYFTVGWLWYVGVLVPMIGIVQAGLQSHADRFTYLPSIGLLMAAVWVGAEFTKSKLVAVIPLALAAITVMRIPLWSDSNTLFRHTLAVTGANPMIAANLGYGLVEQGENREAVKLLESAVKAAPKYARAWSNLGTAYERLGRYSDAVTAFEKAYALEPNSGSIQMNMGVMRIHAQKDEEAVAFFERALQLPLTPPETANVHVNLGSVLGRKGKFAEAEQHFRAAILASPTDVSAHRNLAQALVDQKRRGEAIRHLNYALGVTGNNPNLWQFRQSLLGGM